MDSWLRRAAARRPDQTAIVAGERELTYAELQRLAAGAATSPALAGAKAGRGVALDAGDRLQFTIDLHACLELGGAAVPIDPRLSDAERDARVGVGAAPGSEVATVMHTSGTTAEPKPVALTYGNWEANAAGSALALGLDACERWLCAMPLSHVGGLSILIRSSIYATTVVLHERFETGAVLEELMNPERRITIVSLVPTMLQRLLDAGLSAPPGLRWALLGGGPIAPALLARAAAAGVAVAPTYGMTEACSQIATFGFPLLGAELRLSDDEVVVRGPMVAQGTLSDDGWLHTGDLGRFDDRGRLEIVGRKADTIVSGGENIAPAEVEAVLLSHPTVSDVAVLGRADPEWGEAVVALVVARAGAAPDLDQLRTWCRERLAPFKVPKTIELVKTLPRSESGKLLRRELRRTAVPDSL